MLKVVICSRVTCDVPGCPNHFDSAFKDGQPDAAARAAGWECLQLGHPLAPEALAVFVHRCPACVASGAGPARWSAAIEAMRAKPSTGTGSPDRSEPIAKEATS